MQSVDTVTRASIAAAFRRELGLTCEGSSALVQSILDHMCLALERGENVKIRGFGTFVLLDKAERIGRNPKTGVEHTITPRRVMTFRAGGILKDRIIRADRELAAFEDVRPRMRANQR
jgi:integration host factor subunit alpha